MHTATFNRPLPPGLEGLSDLALDVRWTWSHATDRLWEMLDQEAWERTRNPYYILHSVAQSRLEEAAANPEFLAALQAWVQQRRRYVDDPGWYGRREGGARPAGIAYFSMEFGLGEALPMYSGGLGILAGDFLKTASDLGVPVVGVGLLYQQGYFRQLLDAEGRQGEAYPYSDPMTLPIQPVLHRQGGWLRVRVPLPGRSVWLRVWQACVGKVSLYLLDANDPLNSPQDRGATAQLYPSDARTRLIQEVLLGIGGWSALEELGLPIEICHLNEGHAAFAVLARTLGFMRRTGRTFPVAFRAVRAGNIFTTHTPLAAAFDRFAPALIHPYLAVLADVLQVPVEELLGLGRQDPQDSTESFNMAFLALRGSGAVNAVSRLHGQVSRELFHSLFPGRPACEVPVGHVTNGVHMPTWDSREADALWTRVCGKSRWMGDPDQSAPGIEQISDEELWTVRTAQRHSLVRYARRRLLHQMRTRGASVTQTQRAQSVLDPNVLTLGFARRFAEYKRPHLLLHDPERLAALLCRPGRPVQLIVAGKAHPYDAVGKRLLHAMTSFAARADVWSRVVFLEDYDIALAQSLVAGIDVWLNTPRRPWEACGTSGMKILVNGGMNCSVADGWWDEAYSPEVGWAIGSGFAPSGTTRDAADAEALYTLLEQRIIPEYYTRDQDGLPREWLCRIRASMSRLTPQFSGNRMVRDYIEAFYEPATEALRRRTAYSGKLAGELESWLEGLQKHWSGIRFGDMRIADGSDTRRIDVQVYLGECDPEHVQVQLYADPDGEWSSPTCEAMTRQKGIPGTVGGYWFSGVCPSARPVDHFTPRIVPFHSDVRVPLETSLILWRS